MVRVIEVGTGWCESKQAICDRREQCEAEKLNIFQRMVSTNPQPNGILDKIIFSIARTSTPAMVASAANRALGKGVDVNEELERLDKLDLLLVRNCGATCIIEGALDTPEFRDLIPESPSTDEPSTMQNKSLRHTIEEFN